MTKEKLLSNALFTINSNIVFIKRIKKMIDVYRATGNKYGANYHTTVLKEATRIGGKKFKAKLMVIRLK